MLSLGSYILFMLGKISTIPLAKLLRNELRSVGNKIIMRNADVCSPFLNPDKLRNLWQLHLNKDLNAGYLLWSILIYGAWKLEQ